ncbi:hypothetical protein ACWEIJ_19195 [Lentzea sp. NPDC004789]
MRFPHRQLPPITRKLSFRNSSEAAVTLPVSVDQAAITVSAEEIVVPGGGRVVVGGIAVAVGFTAEAEMYELTVTTLRLPKGVYSVDALVHGDGEHTWASTGKIVLDRPTAITIDARQGEEVGAWFDRAVVREFVGIDAVYPAGGVRVQTGVSPRTGRGRPRRSTSRGSRSPSGRRWTSGTSAPDGRCSPVGGAGCGRGTAWWRPRI